MESGCGLGWLEKNLPLKMCVVRYADFVFFRHVCIRDRVPFKFNVAISNIFWHIHIGFIVQLELNAKPEKKLLEAIYSIAFALKKSLVLTKEYITAKAFTSDNSVE